MSQTLSNKASLLSFFLPNTVPSVTETTTSWLGKASSRCSALSFSEKLVGADKAAHIKKK